MKTQLDENWDWYKEIKSNIRILDGDITILDVTVSEEKNNDIKMYKEVERQLDKICVALDKIDDAVIKSMLMEAK